MYFEEKITTKCFPSYNFVLFTVLFYEILFNRTVTERQYISDVFSKYFVAFICPNHSTETIIYISLYPIVSPKAPRKSHFIICSVDFQILKR